MTTVVETDESADSNEIEDAPASAPAARQNGKAMGPLDFERFDQEHQGRSSTMTNYESFGWLHNETFSCQQVGALIDLVSFDDGKIEVVKLTRTRIVDVKTCIPFCPISTTTLQKEEAQKLLAGIWFLNLDLVLDPGSGSGLDLNPDLDPVERRGLRVISIRAARIVGQWWISSIQASVETRSSIAMCSMSARRQTLGFGIGRPSSLYIAFERVRKMSNKRLNNLLS